MSATRPAWEPSGSCVARPSARADQPAAHRSLPTASRYAVASQSATRSARARSPRARKRRVARCAVSDRRIDVSQRRERESEPVVRLGRVGRLERGPEGLAAPCRSRSRAPWCRDASARRRSRTTWWLPDHDTACAPRVLDPGTSRPSPGTGLEASIGANWLVARTICSVISEALASRPASSTTTSRAGPRDAPPRPSRGAPGSRSVPEPGPRGSRRGRRSHGAGRRPPSQASCRT